MASTAPINSWGVGDTTVGTIVKALERYGAFVTLSDILAGQLAHRTDCPTCSGRRGK